MSRRRGLIALGEGAYTVAEIARILQPKITSRKVRYWLNKGILGEPIRWGIPGKPTLLSFEQLLKVRTIQQLRGPLGFPLQKITPAVEKLSSFVFGRLFAEAWYELRFFQTTRGRIGVVDSSNEAVEIETGQWVMPDVFPELEAYMRETRRDWERKEVDVEGFSNIVSNAGVVGGSPTIRGTRLETAFVAHLAEDTPIDNLKDLYPYVEQRDLLQAIRFEGMKLAA